MVALCSACRVSDLSFRTDERLEITSPENESTVNLPFEVSWTIHDFQVVGPDGSDSDDAGYFAVLLDESPMPPGEDLAYFGRDDDSCTVAAGCPDEAYLADRGIHATKEMTFLVDAIADTRPTDRPTADDDHELTVILLNGKSERIGEAAFRVDFTVEREI